MESSAYSFFLFLFGREGNVMIVSDQKPTGIKYAGKQNILTYPLLPTDVVCNSKYLKNISNTKKNPSQLAKYNDPLLFPGPPPTGLVINPTLMLCMINDTIAKYNEYLSRFHILIFLLVELPLPSTVRLRPRES